ncbi:MAG TPA: protein kinase [Candidatus Eisenbacteria bacterium]|nr:protein kinase [Candidatus Eisenbacteria bacterium]
MALEPGVKLGPYEILSPLGAGGMGEVYRARDTRLGRDVAVKVLPDHLSSQPEIRARFEREAKTVSSLNHPNICTLFDVGTEGETAYLVMELIEGDTLATRIGRGAIAGPELLRIGAQVADALDRAHRAGVIHRDLKPGNIMLTKSGAKLMDFGLARATGLAGPGAGSSHTGATLTHSPTVGKALTAEGTLLGTFQYMSPEQLEGAEADARSDIWALGCVLYEMATGRRAFEGRSQASLIAAILEREPAPIAEIPSGSASAAIAGGAPQGLDRLIRNCLTKDPEERIQTAHDIKLQLRGIAEAAGLSTAGSTFAPQTPLPGDASSIAAARGKARRASPLPWAIAAVAVVAAIATAAYLYPRANAPKAIYRFRPDTAVPGSRDTIWPRISPDGRNLVYVVIDSLNNTVAYVRGMDEIVPRRIPGTDGLTRPYWSPDGREIAFISDGKMKRLDINGGSPVVVCEAQGGADLSWGSKGTILMDGRRTDSLRYVPAGGGELKPATTLDRAAGELGHAWPYFLPDGEHFLYISYSSLGAERGKIHLGKIGALTSKLLGESDGRVEYAPGGWVLYVRGASLVARKLDMGKGELTGPAIPLVEDLRIGGARGHFSSSESGVFAFARLPLGENRSLRLASRSGAMIGESVASGTLANPKLSADGKFLLVERRVGTISAGEISILDLARGTDTKLTFTNGRASTPEWSPDGRRFAYSLLPEAGDAKIRIGSVDGLGAQDSVPVPPRPQLFLWQWAAAGSQAIMGTINGEMFTSPTDGSAREWRRLVDASLTGGHAQISPDGRWLAYAFGTARDVQVYVQSLTGTPGRWQISNSLAMFPRWTKGGREIVFEGLDGRLMAVDIDTAAGFRPGTPRALFLLPMRSSAFAAASWSVDASGEKFALVVPPPQSATSSIEIVTDFQTLVTRK